MMAYIGVVPAALRGTTSYANLAAAVAANPSLQGQSGSPYDAPYLDANELQYDLAGRLIQNYVACDPVTSHVDIEKTKQRRKYLANLPVPTATKGTGGCPGDIVDGFAWVASIRAAIAAFPD